MDNGLCTIDGINDIFNVNSRRKRERERESMKVKVRYTIICK